MQTKRWQRRTVRTLSVLAVLFILLFFIGTDPVDTRPYFTTAYYQRTIQNLDTAIAEKKETSGTLWAGFARMGITPKIGSDGLGINGKPVKMAGYSDGQFAKGVHDSIFAKAVALEVDGQEIVLLSADLLLTPETVVLQVAENLKDRIPRAHLFFGATHTHASMGHYAPGFVGETSTGEYMPERVEWLAERYTELIQKALSDKKPARFATTHVDAPELVRNRLIGETGRLNPQFDVLSFVQNDGTRAAIGIFSAHATTIAPWNDQLSADYPGYFERWMEGNGYETALFFAGTVGSQSNQGQGEKFDKVQYIGESLGHKAQEALAEIPGDSLAHLQVISASIALPELQAFYISENRRLAPWLGHKLIPEPKSVLLQGFRLNHLVWVAMPCELSGEYGIDLKNALQNEGYEAVLTSFNGQYLGYVVPQKYYRYDSYEPRLMGWYGPNMGDYLMELNFKLCDALTDKRL